MVYGFASLAGYLADKAATEARALCGLSRQVVGGSQLRWLVPAFCTALLCVAGSARGETGASSDALYDIDIPAMNAAEALNRLAEQTDSILLFPYDLAQSREANAIVGQYTLLDALDVLLENTGLSGGLSDKQVIQISEVEADTDNDEGETMKASRRAGLSAILASVFTGGVAAQEPMENREEDEQLALEEIVVTGSRIRGAQSASPVVTISREEIDMAGFATVEEIVENLPQNFGAGATADATNASNKFQAVGGDTDDFGGGTSVNLRGLGADNTLVLLNGRRMSPSGSSASFTNIASIPTTAIERVEVMTDGASAIYGSDAIGGVINFVLRTNYDGAETNLRYGADAAGDTSNVQLAQSFGTSWDTGSFLFNYEYFDSEALASRDRTFTASNDLSPFGGTDRRRSGGNPSNILIDGTYYAIPSGQDGTSLTASDFDSSSPRNLFNARLVDELIPSIERNSGFVHFRQTLGVVELFGAARLSQEENARRRPQPIIDFTVPGDDPGTPDVVEGNPFFVDPTGTGLTTIVVDNYTLEDDFGPNINFGEIRSSGASLGVLLEFSDNWRAELAANWSEEEATIELGNEVDTVALRAAVSETDPNLAFNPFGDGSNTNPVVLESLVDRRQFDARSKNDLWSINFDVDGDVFEVPGGTAKIATGVDFREESLLGFDPALPDEFQVIDLSRDILAVYGELFVPLVSGSNRRPGVHRLEVSLAARFEDYSDFGDTTNPKFGILWSPIKSLGLRGTYGTSFRAPSLDELDSSRSSWGYIPDIVGLGFPVLVATGRNSELQPQEATTWTAGFQWNPESVEGLSLDVTYFDVDFSGRIETPSNSIIAPFRDPRLASLTIFNPTDEQIAAVVNNPIFDPEFLNLGFFPASDFISGALPVGAIGDSRFLNLADSIVTGAEVQLSYSFDTHLGSIGVGFNGSYLFDFERRILPTDPLVDEVDTLGRPVDFRARGDVSWTSGPWTIAGFVNYTDGYTDNVSSPERAVDSWTTVDLTIAYNTGNDAGLLKDTRIALTTNNLFDEDPPFVDTIGGVGYDATNANPLGRFFSFRLTKNW